MLKINIDGDASGFKTTLDAVRMQAKQAGAEMSQSITGSWTGALKAGVAGLAGFAGFEGLKSLVEHRNEQVRTIRELAEAFDMSTDSVQAWQRAMEKAGQSPQAFFAALDILRSKQREAATNPSAMRPFLAAGLTEKETLGLNAEDLAKRLLSGNVARPILRQLLGRSGPRFQAAMEYMDGGKPMYSEAEIEGQKKVDLASAKLKAIVSKAADAQIGFWSFMLSGHPMDAFRHLSGASTLGKIISPAWANILATAVRGGAGAPTAATVERAQADKDSAEERADLAAEAKDAATREADAKRHEAEQKLTKAQEAGMTTEHRRQALIDERGTNQLLLDYFRPKNLPKNATDAERIKAGAEDDVMKLGYRTRIAEINNEIKKLNPGMFEFQQTGMARAGLMSSSAFAFGSAYTGIAGEVVRLLKNIGDNTSQNGGPWQ